MTTTAVVPLPSTPARDRDHIDPFREPWRDERGALHVQSYADVAYLLHCDQASKDVTQAPGFDPVTAHVTTLFLWTAEGERRERLREVLLPWIGARSVPTRRATVAALAAAGATALPQRFDAYRDYGVRITTTAVADLVGVTLDDMTWMLDRQREHLPTGHSLPAQPEVDERLAEVLGRPGLVGMVAAMRDHATAGALSDREARAMVWGVVQASTLNVAATIAGTVGLLIEHGSWPPRADAIGRAVEEAARLLAPFPVTLRRVSAPIVLPSGVQLAPRTKLQLHIDAANRDPRSGLSTAVPLDQFDPDREPNRHLSWSAGLHRCAGVAVARMMVAEAVAALARLRPELALDGPWRRYVSTEDGWSAAPVVGGVA